MFTEASWKASYILRYQICFLHGRRKKATGMALFSLLHLVQDDPALSKLREGSDLDADEISTIIICFRFYQFLWSLYRTTKWIPFINRKSLLFIEGFLARQGLCTALTRGASGGCTCSLHFKLTLINFLKITVFFLRLVMLQGFYSSVSNLHRLVRCFSKIL